MRGRGKTCEVLQTVLIDRVPAQQRDGIQQHLVANVAAAVGVEVCRLIRQAALVP